MAHSGSDISHKFALLLCLRPVCVSQLVGDVASRETVFGAEGGKFAHLLHRWRHAVRRRRLLRLAIVVLDGGRWHIHRVRVVLRIAGGGLEKFGLLKQRGDRCFRQLTGHRHRHLRLLRVLRPSQGLSLGVGLRKFLKEMLVDFLGRSLRRILRIPLTVAIRCCFLGDDSHRG